MTAGPADPAMDGRVRRALLALFALGSLGTGVELLLLEHFEKPPQWTPLALLAIGVVLAAGQLLAASRAAVRLFQAVMLLFCASGLAGIAFHYHGNVEFERELHPERTGWALFRGAVMGATPALAPGTMILLGSIGLLYAYRHPALGQSRASGPPSEEQT